MKTVPKTIYNYQCELCGVIYCDEEGMRQHELQCMMDTYHRLNRLMRLEPYMEQNLRNFATAYGELTTVEDIERHYNTTILSIFRTGIRDEPASVHITAYITQGQAHVLHTDIKKLLSMMVGIDVMIGEEDE